MIAKQLVRSTWIATMGWPVLCVLAAAASVDGTVRTAAGRPITRATVSLAAVSLAASSTQQSSLERTTLTDNDGKYQFEDVAPGSYNVSARKNGWEDSRVTIVISETNTTEKTVTPFVLTPTLATRAIDHLRFGSLAYVAIFGVLILIANFFIAPRPARSVTWCGWGVTLLSLAIGFVKLESAEALVLSGVAIAIAASVNYFGSRIAARRVEQLDAERQTICVAREQEQNRLHGLVGRAGVALTDLKSCGTAEIDGQMISVRALRGFIPMNTRVVVRVLDGHTPVVDDERLASVPSDVQQVPTS